MAIIGHGKKEIRQFCNELDTIVRDIQLKNQADIDKIGVKIDAELESCGRELTGIDKTVSDIKPIVDRVMSQLPANTPADIRLLMESAMSEILNKVDIIKSNASMVQKNIKDVDKLTDELDTITDSISTLVKKVDTLTDKYQV